MLECFYRAEDFRLNPLDDDEIPTYVFRERPTFENFYFTADAGIDESEYGKKKKNMSAL